MPVCRVRVVRGVIVHYDNGALEAGSSQIAQDGRQIGCYVRQNRRLSAGDTQRIIQAGLFEQEHIVGSKSDGDQFGVWMRLEERSGEISFVWGCRRHEAEPGAEGSTTIVRCS
jgi:hypothetical protein